MPQPPQGVVDDAVLGVEHPLPDRSAHHQRDEVRAERKTTRQVAARESLVQCECDEQSYEEIQREACKRPVQAISERVTDVRGAQEGPKIVEPDERPGERQRIELVEAQGDAIEERVGEEDQEQQNDWQEDKKAQ